MCVPNSCSEGLGRGTTYFADIFADQAPLMVEQMLRETPCCDGDQGVLGTGGQGEWNHRHGNLGEGPGTGGKGPQ
jgi:hypothetical protein